MKKIRYLLEAIAAYIILYLFKLIGFETASAIGGFIARKIGPKLKVSNVARRNIKNSMSKLSDIEIEEIITGMWDNLGRTVAELPNIENLSKKAIDKKIDITGFEIFEQAIANNKGAILFSGHLANWEIGAKAAMEKGLPLNAVYRAANNKMVNQLIQKFRNEFYNNMYPKGSNAAKKLVRHLKSKENIAMLVDQKMNDGIAVPFFGRDAMTAPATAQLALKFGVPIIPVQVIRKNKTEFKVIIHQPLDIEGKNEYEIMCEINNLLEEWILENPEQWFWVHKRWVNNH